jgi:hypothetical protein
VDVAGAKWEYCSGCRAGFPGNYMLHHACIGWPAFQLLERLVAALEGIAAAQQNGNPPAGER